MREALAGGEVVDEAPSPREIGEDDTVRGAKITIEPVSWHLASTTGVIRRDPLPSLPRLVPAPRLDTEWENV